MGDQGRAVPGAEGSEEPDYELRALDSPFLSHSVSPALREPLDVDPVRVQHDPRGREAALDQVVAVDLRHDEDPPCGGERRSLACRQPPLARRGDPVTADEPLGAVVLEEERPTGSTRENCATEGEAG